MTPLEATLKGAGEIGFTILTISISLVAVSFRYCSWAASSDGCSVNRRYHVDDDRRFGLSSH